ncbi:MAG: hypothetical protein U1F43_25800 [Myxococcota bacterium]
MAAASPAARAATTSCAEPSSGQCLCTPDCDGKACGDDGCGGSCGECGAHEACGDGQCIACEPQCGGKTCGDDSCGGSCGSCDANETCGGNGQCGCPTTSCGGACCDAGDKCFQSECCTPRCSGKECGSDGCGGTCGTCGSGETCGSGGQCTCTPDCSGKECGDNGCGGSCGSCGSGETCNAAGQCTSGNAQCSGEGFDVKRQSATDNGTSINWVGLNTPSGAFDALTVDFYQVQGASGPEYPVESQAAYNIPGGNYQTCVLCVLLMKGCTAAGSCANATYYFATSGILTLVEFTPGVGGQLEGVITNAVLEEVTIDAQGVSTIVPGGKKWCMENQVFLGPSTLVAP